MHIQQTKKQTTTSKSPILGSLKESSASLTSLFTQNWAFNVYKKNDKQYMSSSS